MRCDQVERLRVEARALRAPARAPHRAGGRDAQSDRVAHRLLRAGAGPHSGDGRTAPRPPRGAQNCRGLHEQCAPNL